MFSLIHAHLALWKTRPSNYFKLPKRNRSHRAATHITRFISETKSGCRKRTTGLTAVKPSKPTERFLFIARQSVFIESNMQAVPYALIFAKDGTIFFFYRLI